MKPLQMIGVLALVALKLHADSHDYPDDRPYNILPAPGKNDERYVSYDVTPIAGPRVADGVDLFVTADFIYWRPREEGTAFAVSGVANNNVFYGSGRVYKPDFHFEPGFKVGLGFNLGHDGWDLFLEYTWLRSYNNSNSVSRDNILTSNLTTVHAVTPGINNLFVYPEAIVYAKGSWDFHYNVLDFEIGRNFYISQFLTLRPFVGLKGAWNDEKFKVHYIQAAQFKMRINQDVRGVGIHSGLDTGWHLGCGWSIFGDFALTAFWSKFEVSRKDLFNISLTEETFETTLDTRNDFYTLKGILELDLGLRWDKWWCNDSYHFALQAGWEEQIWWSYNNYLFAEESAHGDLSLHGLTIKARFDF